MKSTQQIARGDYQTPVLFAKQVCEALVREGLKPKTIIEPTCGKGHFLLAAGEAFPQAKLRGRDLNKAHLAAARSLLRNSGYRADLRQVDFFNVNWREVLRKIIGPVLLLGNPPWVTSAVQGTLSANNLPLKSNFMNFRGLDAKTGKSNFDIAEYMIIQLLEAAQGQELTVAMLIKTGTARRILKYAVNQRLPVREASIRKIDARKVFGVTVPAGLLTVSIGRTPSSSLLCPVYPDLESKVPAATIGVRSGNLVADAIAYDSISHLVGQERSLWRSGVKHDCSKVLELSCDQEGNLWNGYGERVDVESDVLYPLLKSADLRGVDRPRPRRWLLLPQSRLTQDPELLAESAPRAWRYLLEHSVDLDRRRSSIYRNRPRFSVFGLGPYSFAPWKVAISGIYKKVNFTLVGPCSKRPVLLDDTCYALSFEDEDRAAVALRRLRSPEVQKILQAFVFWDSMRPITKDVLGKIDLSLLND